MRAPLCFCNGVIRSGSTWSFNVCRELMQEVAIRSGKPFGSTYLDQPQLEQFITQHLNRVPGPTVIKAHSLGPVALQAVKAGNAKAVCTFRDPRDSVASDLEFMGQGLEFSVRRVMGTLELLQAFQTTDQMLLVRYEQMMSDPKREIRRIASHLEIDLDPAAVDRVDSKTNLEASRELCGTLKYRPANTVLSIASHRVDPQTHLHENHISNAKTGRWKSELPARHGRWLTEFFAAWLIRLGYETQESLQAVLMANIQRQPASVRYGANSSATLLNVHQPVS